MTSESGPRPCEIPFPTEHVAGDIALEPSRCTRCGRCVRICPCRVFTLDDTRLPQITPAHRARCISCGHCTAICPALALSLNGTNPAELTPVSAAPLSSTQRDMLFRNRRSIRWYTSQPVSRQELLAALDDARYAPSARNQQVVDWLVIDDPDCLKPLALECAEALHDAGGSYASLAAAQARGDDVILRGAPCLVLAHAPRDAPFASEDCTAAVTCLELSLHSRGLGACWSGFVVAAARKGLHRLPLCLTRLPFAGLMVGHPAQTFQRVPERPPLRIDWI